jgi:hypothetical protein
MLRSGIDDERVAYYGRFKRVSVMLDTYQNVLISDDDAALELLDRHVYAGCSTLVVPRSAPMVGDAA